MTRIGKWFRGAANKIGSGLKTAGKWVAKHAAPVVSKVAGTVADVAQFVPGKGQVVALAARGVKAVSDYAHDKWGKS